MDRRKFLKSGAGAIITMPYIFSRNSPVFASSSTSHIVSVFDQHATSLHALPGKTPNGDGIIVDKVQSYEYDRIRISNMVDTAVMKITGKSTIGHAWESLFPGGQPNKNTTIAIKINMSYGERVEENDWKKTYCPFGTKAVVSDAIVAGLAQMMDGYFPVENITLFDIGYSSSMRKGYSLVQGYRPVFRDANGKMRDDIPGTYKLHWVNTRYKSEIPDDAPQFVAAPDFPEKYKAPQRIMPAVYENDFMINISNAKDHREAGITGAMKNTYGCTDNPVGTHGNVWRLDDSPYAGTRLCIPVFYKNIDQHSPCILSVLDALSCLYNGGPLAGNVKQSNTISVSRDPVALDTSLLKMINKYRSENGHPTLSDADGRTSDGHPNAPFLRFAADVHKLGSPSLKDSHSYDLSSSNTSWEVPAFDKSHAKISDPLKNKGDYKLEVLLDDSKRTHEIDSRIEDTNGNVIKYLKSQSTKSSKTTINWDHKNENKETLEEGIYVWHVKVDGLRHTRIINDY